MEKAAQVGLVGELERVCYLCYGKGSVHESFLYLGNQLCVYKLFGRASGGMPPHYFIEIALRDVQPVSILVGTVMADCLRLDHTDETVCDQLGVGEPRANLDTFLYRAEVPHPEAL